MADSRAQAYAQQLDLLTKQAEALSPEARARILKLLDEANKEILADLAKGVSAYNSARLQALKAQIDRVMSQFADQAAAQVNEMERKAFEQTARQIDVTVAAGVGELAVPAVLDVHLLKVVQGYTADLITGLTRDASAKINAAIQRGAMGGMNLQQLVGQVGNVLEDGKFSGLFSQVGERAMSIAVNEIGRIQSLASVSRINALAPRHPGLMKRWKHLLIGRPRLGHIAADGQIRKPDEPFLVEGEELMYPRDPNGSAENTINCHCLVMPHFDDALLKPTDAERQLLKSYGLRVAA